MSIDVMPNIELAIVYAPSPWGNSALVAVSPAVLPPRIGSKQDRLENRSAIGERQSG